MLKNRLQNRLTRSFFSVAALGLLLAGCTTTIRSPQPVEAGWQLFPVPTTANGPGTVIGVNKGASRFIVDLSTKIFIATNKVAPPSFHGGESYDLNAFAALLEGNPLSRYFSAQGSLTNSRTASFDLVLGDPVWEERSPQYTVAGPNASSKALNKYLQEAEFVPEPGYQYYFIAATRASKSLTFLVSADTTRYLGGQANLTNIARANLVRAKTIGGTNELRKEWNEDYRIEYQAQPISILSGATGLHAGELGTNIVHVPWLRLGEPTGRDGHP